MPVEKEILPERHGVVFALWDGKHIQLEKRIVGNFEGFVIIPGGGVEEGESPVQQNFGKFMKNIEYF